jgi:hypothetical protein
MPIGMKHLILAAETEFEKKGRSCVKSDFGKYYDLIQWTEE